MDKQFSPSDLDRLLSFQTDSNTLLVGPTSSGKTTLLRHILAHGLFDNIVENIYICVPDETADDWKKHANKKIKLIVGDDAIVNFLRHSDECPEHSVVVFDDLMTLLDKTPTRLLVERWFFVVTHHRHLWTFFVTHDMFHKHMVTVRRNTQNFILFNAFQSDMRASNEFVQRLVGSVSPSFMSLWRNAVDSGGWIRIDQKLGGDYPLKTVVSAKELSVQRGAVFGCRSDSVKSPLFLDVVSNIHSPTSGQFQIPENQVHRHHGALEAEPSGSPGNSPTRSLSANGTSDL